MRPLRIVWLFETTWHLSKGADWRRLEMGLYRQSVPEMEHEPMNTKLIEAAKRYAASDPSDPFAFRRAMTHLRSGVASYTNKDGAASFYDAELHYEARAITLPSGKTLEWQAEVYRNVHRP